MAWKLPSVWSGAVEAWLGLSTPQVPRSKLGFEIFFLLNTAFSRADTPLH